MRPANGTMHTESSPMACLSCQHDSEKGKWGAIIHMNRHGRGNNTNVRVLTDKGILDRKSCYRTCYQEKYTREQPKSKFILKCSTFITFSETRQRRRCVPVRQVARPQLPVAVGAPAFDAAAAQQSTRVGISHGEGHDSWVRPR